MLRILGYLTGFFVLCGLVAAGAVIWVFWTYGQDLPDYTQLENYEPPITTRVHAGDGSLLTEYAVQRRVFVPIEAIPEIVRDAFLAAETDSPQAIVLAEAHDEIDRILGARAQAATSRA